MPTLPTSLALATIADGASIVASDHRNNYAAIQTEANSLITTLGAGATGQVLNGNGTTLSWLNPPGYEYSYVEFTANVTVTATTDGTANTVVTAAAVTFDGATAVIVEFFAPTVRPGATGNSGLLFNLYQDGSDIGRMWETQKDSSAVASGGTTGVRAARRMTPASGSRTYSVRAWRVTSDGTVLAGVGGTGAYLPGYIRITKV